MNVGIMIDDWKLTIFKKTLDKEGYDYLVSPGLSPDILLISVTTDDVNKLTPIVAKMNKEAARSKMN